MQLSIQETQGKVEVMAWEPMTNPPKESGHYAVAHRGRVIGQAYYFAGDYECNRTVGWDQLPSWGPTHWLDGSYMMDVEGKAERFWAPKPPPKKATAAVKRSRWPWFKGDSK